jgi:hypothetical protein
MPVMFCQPRMMPVLPSSLRLQNVHGTVDLHDEVAVFAEPGFPASLRQHQFDTVLGPITFDAKGDVPGRKPVWYVWRGGTYTPLAESASKE